MTAVDTSQLCNMLTKTRVKEYEILKEKRDPQYNDFVRAVQIVKDFIITNKLIVYGGTTIDYALRLHGDKIYTDDMLLMPDLDFYSPDNTRHAYELADILYGAGFTEARTINALYVQTMKVDIGNNHWVADISYLPQDIFDKLPTFEYEGMLNIHPNFQRIDMHRSLSFPYENEFMETIFHRWNKDVTRFNLMAKYYPIDKKTINPTQSTEISMNTVSVDSGVLKSSLKNGFGDDGVLLYGFASYNLLCRLYAEFLREMSSKVKTKKWVRAPKHLFEIKNKKLSFIAPDNSIDIISKDPQHTINELKLDNIDEFLPYKDLIFGRFNAKIPKTDTNINVYDGSDSLVSYNKVRIDGNSIYTVNVQYLLVWCLTNAYKYSNNNIITAESRMYFNMYIELMTAIENMQSMLDDIDSNTLDDKIKQLVHKIRTTSPFFPSVIVYGGRNYSDAYEKLINYIDVELIKIKTADNLDDEKLNDILPTQLLNFPRNYYPERGNPAPTFDYDSYYFQRDGRKIESNVETIELVDSEDANEQEDEKKNIKEGGADKDGGRREDKTGRMLKNLNQNINQTRKIKLLFVMADKAGFDNLGEFYSNFTNDTFNELVERIDAYINQVDDKFQTNDQLEQNIFLKYYKFRKKNKDKNDKFIELFELNNLNDIDKQYIALEYKF